MYKDKTIAVVIPAHNEASQIGKVIETMPEFVDHIIIVDDVSTDNTVETIEQYQQKYQKIVLIRHEHNQGCGGALASGYKFAAKQGFDVAVRMDGDGQMDPKDLQDHLKKMQDKKTEEKMQKSSSDLFKQQKIGNDPLQDLLCN